jgi:protein Jumonji
MGWYHHDCFVRTARYIFTLLQIGGMEIDLPRLYQTVQSLGGLKEVIEKKKWPKVSDAMKIPKLAQDRVTKLDDIYCKYLLPYDTLSPGE